MLGATTAVRALTRGKQLLRKLLLVSVSGHKLSLTGLGGSLGGSHSHGRWSASSVCARLPPRQPGVHKRACAANTSLLDYNTLSLPQKGILLPSITA